MYTVRQLNSSFFHFRCAVLPSLNTLFYLTFHQLEVLSRYRDTELQVGENNSYTVNNMSSLEGTLQYYHNATPGEPLQGSPGVAW